MSEKNSTQILEKGYVQMKKKRQKKRRSGSLNTIILFAVGALLSIALGYALQYELLAEEETEQYAAAARIEINELMSKNVSVLQDGNGDYPDWIEIVNREETAVDLTGWQLLTADRPLAPFTFPQMVLGPGEYAVIFATGQEQSSTMHAAFKLSASGEEVLLIDASGREADRAVLPSMGADQSYAREADGTWISTAYCTPGLENIRENAAAVRTVVDDAICISEVVPLNASLIEGGKDLIELTNNSSQPVSLSGYALSDDPAKPDKYVLGDIVLQGGEYVLIEADGENVPFKLSAEGEQLMLKTPEGRTASFVEWTAMEADQSVSWINGEWTQGSAPTPGYSNDAAGAEQMDRQLTANNSIGLFISEVLASSAEDYEWVELHNRSSNTISLSGFGLSDDPQSPRKWQFPEGVVIGAGDYLVVCLSGRDEVDRQGRQHTNFSLSCSEPETLTLCTPDGAILDRAFMAEMYGDVSIGRKASGGFAYLAECTPGAANSSVLYDNRARQPVFSVQGGIFGAGESIQLSIASPDGLAIYYTLDGSDPDENSMLYTGPLMLNDTTVVRAVAMGGDSYPSYVETQSYLFGVSHTVRVVSVVSDPEGLFSAETGIMASAEGATEANGFEGANFWKDWERSANVEIFETDGTTLVSQGCAIRLHGANSRRRDQKALCLTARMTYDEENRFRARLFSERDYTEYQSFILRAGGQDGEMTRVRDTIIDQLAADAGVCYQESELCVVYLNGEYWGQYDMREKINRFSLAENEGWESTDSVSIVTRHNEITRGSNESYDALMAWIEEHDEATDEDIAYVETAVDLDNYLSWISLMVYSGNQDIGLRRYCNTEEDGLWRWVIFDMDYAFYNDTDSIRRWLDPAGAGAHNVTDNRLFVYVMKNEKVKERFLTRFGSLVTGPWAAEQVVADIEELYAAMLPEMQAHFERWTMISMEKWQANMQEILEYAATREAKIIGYTQQHFGLTQEEMTRYFGEEWSGLGE